MVAAYYTIQGTSEGEACTYGFTFSLLLARGCNEGGGALQLCDWTARIILSMDQIVVHWRETNRTASFDNWCCDTRTHWIPIASIIARFGYTNIPGVRGENRITSTRQPLGAGGAQLDLTSRTHRCHTSSIKVISKSKYLYRLVFLPTIRDQQRPGPPLDSHIG